MKFKGKIRSVRWTSDGSSTGYDWTTEIDGIGFIAPASGFVVIEQAEHEEELVRLRAHVADLEQKLEAARKALAK